MKTETIRYHAKFQTALTYLKALASYDPDYCVGVLQSVYTRYVGSIHRDCRSISFMCVCADLYCELQVICAADAAIDKFVYGQIAAGRLRLRTGDRDGHSEHHNGVLPVRARITSFTRRDNR